MKTLIVDYTIEDKPFTVKALDGSMIQLSANAARVQIDKARYGVLSDPQRTRDVREKLQRLVDAGESSFRVARMAEGDDPAFLVVKTLDLEFTWMITNGASLGTDPEMLDLVPPLPRSQPPAAVVRTQRRAQRCSKCASRVHTSGDEVRAAPRKSRSQSATSVSGDRTVASAFRARLGCVVGRDVRATHALERT